MKRKFLSRIIAGTVISTTLCTLVPVRASAQWVNDYQNNWYFMQDNQKMTGWSKIDGQLYYFNNDGKMLTGWINAGSSWYFLQNNGVLKTGWIKYSNKWYYADDSGTIQGGILNISGKIYIFDDNGVMKTSNTVINGEFYTIGLDGKVVGNKLPTPDKEFDDSGKCLVVLKNTDSKVTSPLGSNFNKVIEDKTKKDAEKEEFYGVEYTLKFKDSNGEILKSETVKKGKSVDLYEPTKAGYNFVGWDANSDGSGKSYAKDDNVEVNKDLSLYAQWTTDTNTYVESITITGSSNVVVNKTTQMTAKEVPSDATNANVTWSVSNGTGSATIDSNGLLTGVTAGTVTVKATASDGSKVSGTKEITVGTTQIQVPVTSISVNSETGIFKITTDGGTLQMTESVLPTTASDQDIEWAVENRTGSATISSTGLVTAVSNGTITVQAKAKDNSGIVGSKTITISGQSAKIPVESIVLSGKDVIATDGGTLQMSANVLPSSATNKEFTWSVETSSDSGTSMTGNAIISNAGLVTALADGTVTVKATSTQNSKVVGTYKITISGQTKKVTKVTVTGADTIATSSAAATLQMGVDILPSDAADKTITWTVESMYDSQTGLNGSATISSTGLVTAISNGKVKVKATAKSGVYGSKVITITGQPIKVSSFIMTTEDNVTGLETNGGKKLTLQMYAKDVAPVNASDKTVTWKVDNKIGTASIDQNGLLTAITNGTVLVTATTNDGSNISQNKLITISGQIVKVGQIIVAAVDNYEKIVADNGILQMNATVKPTNATNKIVTWSVANKDATTTTACASISETGLLTAEENGVVIVTATATDTETGGIIIVGSKEIAISGQTTKVTKITVKATDINGIDASTVAVNGYLNMILGIEPTGATMKDVIWSVTSIDADKKGSVAIDTNNKLIALAAGSVEVKATAKDGSLQYGTTIITITP